jgi:hypothetical protein
MSEDHRFRAIGILWDEYPVHKRPDMRGKTNSCRR